MNTTQVTYVLKQAADETFAFFAAGPEKRDAAIHPARYPDMQLLGWDRSEVLTAARAWLASKGIDADVVLA